MEKYIGEFVIQYIDKDKKWVDGIYKWEFTFKNKEEIDSWLKEWADFHNIPKDSRIKYKVYRLMKHKFGTFKRSLDEL